MSHLCWDWLLLLCCWEWALDLSIQVHTGDNEFTLQLFRCNISFRAYSWSSYLSNNVGIKLQYRCCGSVLSSVQILFSFVSNSLIIHNYHTPKQRKIIFKPSINVYHIIVVMHKFVILTLALQELLQGLQIRQIWCILRQNCSDDSTKVTEGVTLTPKIFGNKQGATLTPEIFGNKQFCPYLFRDKHNLRYL